MYHQLKVRVLQSYLVETEAAWNQILMSVSEVKIAIFSVA